MFTPISILPALAMALPIAQIMIQLQGTVEDEDRVDEEDRPDEEDMADKEDRADEVQAEEDEGELVGKHFKDTDSVLQT